MRMSMDRPFARGKPISWKRDLSFSFRFHHPEGRLVRRSHVGGTVIREEVTLGEWIMAQILE